MGPWRGPYKSSPTSPSILCQFSFSFTAIPFDRFHLLFFFFFSLINCTYVLVLRIYELRMFYIYICVCASNKRGRIENRKSRRISFSRKKNGMAEEGCTHKMSLREGGGNIAGV